MTQINDDDRNLVILQEFYHYLPLVRKCRKNIYLVNVRKKCVFLKMQLEKYG